MSNEVVTTNQEIVSKPTHDLVKLHNQLKQNGYYKNVITPEQYLKNLKYEGTNEDDGSELELTENEGVQAPAQRTSSKKQPKPLAHWNAKIAARFQECDKATQNAWLDSFKIIEKSYVKQLNELKEDLLLAEPIFELLMPFQEYFVKSKQTPAEYFKQLIEFDKELGADPAKAVAKLVVMYNLPQDAIANALDVAENELAHNSMMEQTLQPLKKEINRLKTQLGTASPQEVDYEQANGMADDLAQKIEAFFDQKDKQGQPIYPKAYDYIEDIIELYQTGVDLDTAYHNIVDGAEAAPQYDDQIEEEAPALSPNMPKGRDAEREYLINTYNKIKRGY
jgi:hypothetical protein